MKPTQRIILIAAASIGLGAAGFGLLSLSADQPASSVKPVPLTTPPGPVSFLPEPADVPYDGIVEEAVKTAPMTDSATREHILSRVRQASARWKMGQGIASAPLPSRKGDAPDTM